jgi:hypothetical protein
MAWQIYIPWKLYYRLTNHPFTLQPFNLQSSIINHPFLLSPHFVPPFSLFASSPYYLPDPPYLHISIPSPSSLIPHPSSLIPHFNKLVLTCSPTQPPSYYQIRPAAGFVPLPIRLGCFVSSHLISSHLISGLSPRLGCALTPAPVF